jgi:phage terminase large subunit GpA-like protein
MPGKWRSDNSPWVREILEVFADKSVNELSVMCAAQSAKTQTIMVAMLWAVKQDPGPIQWVMAAADEAKVFARTRLIPQIKGCAIVNDLLSGEEPGLTEINFPGAAFLLTGANSKSKLQSNPKRYLFLDEVRNYPPGAYEMVRKRVRAFWDSKICTISTPDLANDHVHRSYLAGDQRKWHFPCPSCGQLQQLAFAQLRWDEDDSTRPGGKWDFDKVAETIRFECVACGHRLTDTPTNRRMLCSAGRWVKSNPLAASNKVSFQWNALLPPWVKWRDIVEEFIVAHSVLKNGDYHPYKAFVNETLGEPWEDRLKEVTDFGALAHRVAPYRLGDAWPEEKVRILAVDVQRDHFRYVCRAWGPFGESRLIAFGRVDSEGDLDALPASLGVSNVNVCVDSGHEAARVYRICARNRWKAFKGTANEYFAAKDEDGKPVRKLWSVTRADPALGMKAAPGPRPAPIKLYLWSNPSVKDMLAEWMSGLGPNWTIPDVTDPSELADYIAQVTAEKRVERVDARGFSQFDWVQVRRDNHYWDCELMIGVAALAQGLVGKHLVRPTTRRLTKPAAEEAEGQDEQG